MRRRWKRKRKRKEKERQVRGGTRMQGSRVTILFSCQRVRQGSLVPRSAGNEAKGKAEAVRGARLTPMHSSTNLQVFRFLGRLGHN